MEPIDPFVRKLLLCPRCRGELLDDPDGLACAACALLYPVVEGVPWLVDERARALTLDDGTSSGSGGGHPPG